MSLIGKVLIKIVEQMKGVYIYEIIDDEEFRFILGKYGFFVIDPFTNKTVYPSDHLLSATSKPDEISTFIQCNKLCKEVKIIHKALKTQDSRRSHGIGSSEEEEEEEEDEMLYTDDTFDDESTTESA